MTEDLHRAKEILSAEGCTCVFVCGDVVLKRYERDILLRIRSSGGRRLCSILNSELKSCMPKF